MIHLFVASAVSISPHMPLLAVGPTAQPLADWFKGLLNLAAAAVAAWNVFWVLLVKKKIKEATEIFGAILAFVLVLDDWSGCVSVATSISHLFDASAQ